MIIKFARRLAMALSAISSATLLATMPAQSQTAPQGWFKVCSEEGNGKICNVQHIVRAPSGQVVTGISMLELTGEKGKRKLFQVTVPIGRLIPPGIALQIDGGKPQKLDFSICFENRCIAEAPLTDNLVASFKRGGTLRLTSVNFQRQANPVDVSLKGFTQAYDGEPLKRSELQERQKKLEDALAEKRETFEEELKKRQEDAVKEQAGQ